MRIFHSGCAALLLLTCALSATVSCGSVERTYRPSARGGSGGTAGNAGKNSANSGGMRAGVGGSGSGDGASPVAVGGVPGAGGSASGTGDPAPGTAGFSTGPVDPFGRAGSSPGTAGAPPGTAGSPASCTGPNHLCTGSCVSNSSVATCGGSCDPCQAPAGATATCDGNQCGFSCGSMKKCGSKCVPSDGCCSDSDCPAQNGMARQCDTSSNTCKTSGCASGLKPCGNACIASNACCSNNDCSGTCQTCSGPGGNCVPVKNAEDTDSCAGTCDSNGTCKSKLGQTCNTVSGGCIDGTSCADGYCCDSACSGQCRACDLPSKQGTCSTVTSGAPHGTRTKCTTDGGSCGGSCAGKSDSSCDYPTSSCGEAKCSDTNKNMSVDVGTCNAGTCVPPAAKACPKSLICSGKACKTSCDADQDCVSGYICVSHTCYPKQTVIDLPFSASLSGTVTSDGKVSSPIQVGDDASKVQSCGFVSFKISDIPKGAYLVYATFVYTVIKDNGKAYDALGDMVAQKVSYSKLERGSFSLSPSGSVTLFDTVPESSHNDDVSSLLQPEINAGAANLQLRLCFSKASNNDSVANFAQFDMSGEPPVLYVKYQLLPL